MKRERFCPKCGVPITSGVLCSDCAQVSFSFESPLVQVSEFSRTYEKGKWIPFQDIDSLLLRRIKEAVGREDISIEIHPFEFVPQPKEKIIVETTITIDEQVVSLPVRLSYRQCDYGQKEKTGYYEGILQIQNEHDDVLNFIEKKFMKVAGKGVFVTKTQKTKKGIDLYVTNKHFLRIIGQQIIEHFGGTLDLNPQLFSRDHLASKHIYRLNALVVLPTFKKGDVISYVLDKARVQEKKPVILHVTSMGRLIKGKDLLTGKILAFEQKFISLQAVLPLQTAVVNAVEPQVSIIHPESFQQEPLVNSSLGSFSLDQKVTVVVSEYGCLFVP